MTIGFQPSTRFAFLEESDLPTLSETKERPKGTAFIVGHVLLTLLFFVLAASYLGLFIWHVWLRPNN